MSDNSKETLILPKITGLGLIVIGIICIIPFTTSIWQSKMITSELTRDLLFGSTLIIAGGYSFFKSRNQARKSQS